MVVSVKQVIDDKGPLKGKGGALAQWQREATDRLAQVHVAMERLAQSTQSVVGRRWGLYLYRLREPARQVRWRMRSARWEHTTWERIEPLLTELPPGLAQWYVETNELAQVLNHQEQVVRYELKTVRRLASSPK